MRIKDTLTWMFLNTIFLEHSDIYLFTYFYVTVFVLQQENGVMVTQNIQLAKPKILTLRPFTEKSCTFLECKGH